MRSQTDDLESKCLDLVSATKEYTEYLERHKKLRTGWKKTISNEIYDLSQEMRKKYNGTTNIRVWEDADGDRISFPSMIYVVLEILDVSNYIEMSELIHQEKSMYLNIKFGGISLDNEKCLATFYDRHHSFVGSLPLESFYEKLAHRMIGDPG